MWIRLSYSPHPALPGVCVLGRTRPLSCLTFADKKRPKKISLSWYFQVFNLLRPPFYVEYLVNSD
jgi:hypothetical protein